MNLLHIYLDSKCNLIFEVNWSIFLSLTLILCGILFKNLKNIKKYFRNIEIDCAELNIHGQKIKVKPDNSTINIAYKLWVEINTRKIGQVIDYSDDVIEEVYNSWYDFFRVTRELLKEIPAEKATEPNTKGIIEITTCILNEVIRPHLTKWQARFRHWYNKLEESNLSPQKLQTQFVCSENTQMYNFSELKNDMEIVNKTLIEYKTILENIIFENFK